MLWDSAWPSCWAGSFCICYHFFTNKYMIKCPNKSACKKQGLLERFHCRAKAPFHSLKNQTAPDRRVHRLVPEEVHRFPLCSVGFWCLCQFILFFVLNP